MIGAFYMIQGGDGLPDELRRDLPETIWLPEPPSGDPAGELVLTCRPLSGGPAAPLLSRGPGGAWRLHFSVAETIEGVLLERYHGGLIPSIEMKLPFNYSLVPNWIKALARVVLSGRAAAKPDIAFPPETPGYAVEWLRSLARIAHAPADSLLQAQTWPDGKRAAAIITHDVDTDWLFRNPQWLERICDLEERHGFFGAWYSVPCYSQSAVSERGLRQLRERKCEIGAHGFNHDAKLPLTAEPEFERRMAILGQFARRWEIRGFRSEWLYRTPPFLTALAGMFEYDSSVPSHLSILTTETANGCSSCFPYRTHGGLLELPLSLPMDEARHGMGLSPEAFWNAQMPAIERIVELGGLVVLSVHPQSHQFANEASLRAIEPVLRAISEDSRIWIARPDEVAAWSRQGVAVPVGV